MPVRVRRKFDSTELILRGIQKTLRSRLQTNILTEFNSFKNVDLLDPLTNLLLPVSINNNNIICSGLDDISVILERIPGVFIDIDDKIFGRAKTASHWKEDTYNITIISMLMHDERQKLYWANIRFAEAIVDTLLENETMDGVARGCMVDRIIYSNPIKKGSGWYKAAQISVNYLGASD